MTVNDLNAIDLAQLANRLLNHIRPSLVEISQQSVFHRTQIRALTNWLTRYQVPVEASVWLKLATMKQAAGATWG